MRGLDKSSAGSDKDKIEPVVFVLFHSPYQASSWHGTLTRRVRDSWRSASTPCVGSCSACASILTSPSTSTSRSSSRPSLRSGLQKGGAARKLDAVLQGGGAARMLDAVL